MADTGCPAEVAASWGPALENADKARGHRANATIAPDPVATHRQTGPHGPSRSSSRDAGKGPSHEAAASRRT